MRMLVVVSLAVFAATTAHADARICFPKGTPIVAREHLDIRAKSLTTIELFASSAYRVQTRKVDDPKSLSIFAGCVLATTTNKVKAATKGVPWKKKTVGVCDAMTMYRTKYWVEAKLVWTAELCGPEELDEESTKRIAEIWRALDAEITPPATAPAKPPATR